MLEYDWDASVGYWICSTSHAVRKLLGAQLAKEKITLRQFEVLASLSKSKGCGSQSELADELGIEPHTLAGVLKRMERDGLLERTACDEDRRKNKIRPTAKAEAMWSRATAISHGIRMEATRDLTPEELQTFRSLCERVRENVSAASEAFDAQAKVASTVPTASNPIIVQTKT